MPDDAGTLGDALPDVDQLDLVGIDQVDIEVSVGQRGDWDAAALGETFVGGDALGMNDP